jgi:hypothetical protein
MSGIEGTTKTDQMLDVLFVYEATCPATNRGTGIDSLVGGIFDERG